MKIPVIIKVLLFGIVPVFLLAYMLLSAYPTSKTFTTVEEEIEFREQQKDYRKAALLAVKWVLDQPDEPKAHYHFLSNYLKLKQNEKAEVRNRIWQKANDVIDYYKTLKQESDTAVQQMGDYGLAFLSTYYDELSPATALGKATRLNEKGLPFTHELMGDIYCYMYGNYNAAIDQYKLDFYEHHSKRAGIKTVYLLIKLNDFREAQQILLNLNKKQVYLHPTTERKIHFYTSGITWLKSIHYPFIRNIKTTGTIAAFLIFLVWLFFMKSLDLFKEVAIKTIVTIAGITVLLMPMALLAYDFVEYELLVTNSEALWQDIFITGGIEETTKILPVLLMLTFFKKRITPFNLMFSAVLSALLFATLENVLYFNEYHDVSVVSGRAIMSVTGHIIFTSIVAYGIVLFRFKKKSIVMPILCFLMAMCIHGLYNYGYTLRFLPIPLLIVLSGTIVWSSMVNNCLNNSPQFDANKISGFNKKGAWLIAGLSGVILMEFVLNTFEFGSESGKDVFSKSIMSGGPIVLVLTFNMIRMDLVQNKWGFIDFSGIREVVSLNQVKEKQIVLKPLPPKKAILGKKQINAIVKERIQSSDQKNWYFIEMENGSNAMIRFKDSGDQFLDFRVVMHFRKLPAPVPPKYGFLPNQFPFAGWVLCSPKTD